MHIGLWLQLVLVTAAGYLFAVFAGDFVIRRVVNKLWNDIGPAEHTYSYLPRLVGVLERGLYVAALQVGHPEFIGLWLAIKVAGKWSLWREGTKAGEQGSEDKSGEIPGRAIYSIFLIGSGLSVAYAVAGEKIISFLNHGKWEYLGGVLTLIILGSLAFWGVIGPWVDQEGK